MPETVDGFDHDGDTFELRIDAIGRVYAVWIGNGRIDREIYRRAKRNRPLSEFDI